MSISINKMKFQGASRIDLETSSIYEQDGELYIACGKQGDRLQNSNVKVSDLINVLERVKTLEAEFALLLTGGENGKVCSCKRSTD